MPHRILPVLLCAAALAACAARPSPGPEARFGSFDRNGNGVIEPGEAENSPVLDRFFDDIDRNQDRVLDRAEFGAFEQRYGDVGVGPKYALPR